MCLTLEREGNRNTPKKILIARERSTIDTQLAHERTAPDLVSVPGCIPCIQHAEVAPRQNLSTPHFINYANKLSNMPPVTESPSVSKRI